MSVVFFFVFLCLGVPIAFVLGLTALLFVPSVGPEILLGFPQRMFVGVNRFVLMAIPFFILAGALMNEGGMTDRLVRFAQCVVGWVRGGLAMTNVLVSMLFAGVSGSAQADVAAIGKTIIPAMEKEGYERDYAAALTVASSVIGPIIPPSITMLLLAVVADLSVAALFLAGVIPGIIIGLALMCVAYVYARKRDYPRGPYPTIGELLRTGKDAILALVMPVIILGGILSGYFTPTEAAAIAVGYAFVIGYFVYGQIRLRAIPGILLETATLTCAIMFIFATAYLLSWVITFAGIPFLIADWMALIGDSPFVFLLVVNILLLAIGLWMDPGAALVVVVPILLPIAMELGVHPIHFGIVVSVNLIIGMITPPIGYVLFTIAPIANISIERLSVALVPFLFVLVAMLLAITYVPELSLFLPRLFGYVA